MATLQELKAQMDALKKELQAAKIAESTIDRGALQVKLQNAIDTLMHSRGVNDKRTAHQAHIDQYNAEFDEIATLVKTIVNDVLSGETIPDNVRRAMSIETPHRTTDKQGVSRPVNAYPTLKICNKQTRKPRDPNAKYAVGFEIVANADDLAKTQGQKSALKNLRAMGKTTFHIKDLKAASGRKSGFKASDWKWIVPIADKIDNVRPVVHTDKSGVAYTLNA